MKPGSDSITAFAIALVCSVVLDAPRAQTPERAAAVFEAVHGEFHVLAGEAGFAQALAVAEQVVLEFAISEMGRATAITQVGSQSSRRAFRAARDDLEQLRFRPPLIVDGAPQDVVRYQIAYRVESRRVVGAPELRYAAQR